VVAVHVTPPNLKSVWPKVRFRISCASNADVSPILVTGGDDNIALASVTERYGAVLERIGSRAGHRSALGLRGERDFCQASRAINVKPLCQAEAQSRYLSEGYSNEVKEPGGQVVWKFV